MKKKLNIQFLNKIKLSLILLFFISTNYSYSQTQYQNPFLSKKNQIQNTPSNNDRTVLIVFDASRSMEEQIKGETKIHIAKRVLEDVLKKADLDLNIGLRVFGSKEPSGRKDNDCLDSRLVILPSTNNRRSIISEVYKILPQGYTPITYSLIQAVNDLAPYKGEKSIIFIGDGLETCGGDPCGLTHSLKEKGVDLKINVVGFGLKDDISAQEQLMCVALETSGKYFAADNAEELAEGISQSFSETVSGKVITSPVQQTEIEKNKNLNNELQKLPKIQPEKI